MLLEEEHEQVRTFKQKPDGETSGQEADGAGGSKDEATNGDPSIEGDVLAVDAVTEDEPVSELGSRAIERRIAALTSELPEPQDEEASKTLEVQKVCLSNSSLMANVQSSLLGYCCFGPLPGLSPFCVPYMLLLCGCLRSRRRAATKVHQACAEATF